MSVGDEAPAVLVWAPEDYPLPSAGEATRWALLSPDREPVGVLIFNDAGIDWTPANTEDPLAQECAAEVLEFLRGNRQQGAPQDDVLAAIRDAYTGDLDETSVVWG